MPKVLNLRRNGIPVGSALVDRTTPYGNPFRVGRDGTRDEVCDKYERWIKLPEQKALRRRIKRQLHGLDLVCWCAPERCHAETIMRIAND